MPSPNSFRALFPLPKTIRFISASESSHQIFLSARIVTRLFSSDRETCEAGCSAPALANAYSDFDPTKKFPQDSALMISKTGALSASELISLASALPLSRIHALHYCEVQSRAAATEQTRHLWSNFSSCENMCVSWSEKFVLTCGGVSSVQRISGHDGSFSLFSSTQHPSTAGDGLPAYGTRRLGPWVLVVVPAHGVGSFPLMFRPDEIRLTANRQRWSQRGSPLTDPHLCLVNQRSLRFWAQPFRFSTSQEMLVFVAKPNSHQDRSWFPKKVESSSDDSRFHVVSAYTSWH